MLFRCRTVTRPIWPGLDFVGQSAATANKVPPHRWHANICPQSADQIGRFEWHKPCASVADAKHVEPFSREAAEGHLTTMIGGFTQRPMTRRIC